MFCHAKAMVRGSTGSDHGHSAALTQPSKNIRTTLLMEHQWGPIQLVQTLGPDLIQGGQNIARDLELGAAAVQPPVTLNPVEQWIRPGQHLSEAFPGPCPAVIEAHTMLNGSDLQRSHPRRPDARASTPSPPPSAHPRTNTDVSL